MMLFASSQHALDSSTVRGATFLSRYPIRVVFQSMNAMMRTRMMNHMALTISQRPNEGKGKKNKSLSVRIGSWDK
jgi:hypothetical protein